MIDLKGMGSSFLGTASALSALTKSVLSTKLAAQQPPSNLASDPTSLSSGSNPARVPSGVASTNAAVTPAYAVQDILRAIDEKRAGLNSQQNQSISQDKALQNPPANSSGTQYTYSRDNPLDYVGGVFIGALRIDDVVNLANDPNGHISVLHAYGNSGPYDSPNSNNLATSPNAIQNPLLNADGTPRISSMDNSLNYVNGVYIGAISIIDVARLDQHSFDYISAGK